MSWVEVDGAGWSWVELGARFSNTPFFIEHIRWLLPKLHYKKKLQISAVHNF